MTMANIQKGETFSFQKMNREGVNAFEITPSKARKNATYECSLEIERKRKGEVIIMKKNNESKKSISLVLVGVMLVATTIISFISMPAVYLVICFRS